MGWRTSWVLPVLVACGPTVGEDPHEGDEDASGREDGGQLPQPADCGAADGPVEVASVTVATEFFQSRLVLTAEHLVLFAGPELFTMPRCGDALARVGELSSSSLRVATDGVAAFWLDGGELLALDPRTGTIEALAEVTDTVDQIAAGPGRVYLALHFAGDRSGLHVVDAADRSIEQLVATPAGDRIAGIVPAGEDVYVQFSADDGTGRPDRIVRVHPDGALETVLADVDGIYEMAVIDGFIVLRRSTGEPDDTAVMEGRVQDTGELLWRSEGDETPDDIAVVGGRLHGASNDGAMTRLFDIPGDGPPVERTRFASDGDQLEYDLVFDDESAFQVEAELVCEEECDVMECSPPYCAHTPLFPTRVSRTNF
jgi:hypothetical protein